MRNRVKSVPFFIAGRRIILMAKQKVRATRHNGRKGENGVFTAYDIAVNYGLRPNRAKMICCPFHQDKHPSIT